mgnify:CR=1 FL=1
MRILNDPPVEKAVVYPAPWDEQVRGATQFYRATIGFVFDNTEAWDPIRQMMSKLGPLPATAVIDTRVHMLMPDMYPCIPGWHVDGAPRVDNVPQLHKASPYLTHFIMNVGDCAPTHMVSGGRVFDVEGDEAYKELDQKVNDWLDGDRGYIKAESGVIYKLTGRTIHRGSPATKRGWRWFGRISIGDEAKPENEIRTQTQVYLSTLNKGW